jgi:hypothetical protein
MPPAASATRDVSPTGQHVHSVLETLPLTGLLLATALHCAGIHGIARLWNAPLADIIGLGILWRLVSRYGFWAALMPNLVAMAIREDR